MSGLGEGFFSPLEIFYSRRIGKAVGTEPVPIYSGLKLTTRLLGLELRRARRRHRPARGFRHGARTEARLCRILGQGPAPLTPPTLGCSLPAPAARSDAYNYALGLDLEPGPGIRPQRTAGGVQRPQRRPAGPSPSGYRSFIGSWLSMGTVEVISDRFSVDDIGFVPWSRPQTVRSPGRSLFSAPAKRTYPHAHRPGHLSARNLVRARRPTQ